MTRRRPTPRRNRRGATASYIALALPVIGGFAALSIEYAYVQHVQIQLDGLSAAASHAAMIEISSRTGTADTARAAAISVTQGALVEDVPYGLTAADIEFGRLDRETGEFIESEVKAEINAVRVPLVATDVGLGFGRAFFGKEMTLRSCSAIQYGQGNATTGTPGGAGLKNGHFDYDTTAPKAECPDFSECEGTSKHSHEYDDSYDVTWTDAFSDLGGHVPVTACMDGDKEADCSDPDAVPLIGPFQPFRIKVVNADLSPGAWITINGEEIDVARYDDTRHWWLPVYTLQPTGWSNHLTSLTMNFDVNAIANCELIPTVTGSVKGNDPGINGEWRSGALTLQLVTVGAHRTEGRSAGDHDVVVSEADGLLWESTYFWHWGGPAYTADNAEDWEAEYNLLDCPEPEFVSNAPGVGACQ